MPSWAEVQEYARSKYKLAEDKENSFKIVFEYNNGRLQAVIVSRFEALDREWVDFASACCRKDQMDQETALKKNFQFAVGALCLDNVTDPRLLQQLAREANAVIGGTLYSDSLSAADGPAATYVNMVRHNASELVKAFTN